MKRSDYLLCFAGVVVFQLVNFSYYGEFCSFATEKGQEEDKRVAVLLRTHQWSPWIKAIADRISVVEHRIHSRPHDFYVAFSFEQPLQTDGTYNPYRTWNYTKDDVLAIMPKWKGSWLHTNVPVELFSAQHPQYRYVWSIDYDADWSGSWDDLLSSVEAHLEEDFKWISIGHVSKAVPQWVWYQYFDKTRFEEEDYYASFNPYSVYSREFLEELTFYQNHGYLQEVTEATVPSLAHFLNLNVTAALPKCNMMVASDIFDHDKVAGRVYHKEIAIHPVKPPHT
eukprot:TRINITY_DN1681_c0_g1_i1.p1 TRINITY_DN1681_c0_g1~~TRINITY_DN1681_c0_g1_i1.p1  ORF type:complete len:282 (-),score=59.13 TRINITY_DN1681_c0_g1_i1:86-931(-)